MKYSDDPISIGYQVLTENWPLTFIACGVLGIYGLAWLWSAVGRAFKRHQAKKGFDSDMLNRNTPTGIPVEARNQG